MILKVLMWIAVIWIGLWILAAVFSLLPLILLMVGGVVALCCVYALLPENFRLPAVERWVNPDWRTMPASPNTNGSESTSTQSSTTPQTPVQLAPAAQPQLDFTRVIPRTGGKLPDRETLTIKLKEKVIGQEAAIDVLVRVVLGKLASEKNPKPLVVMLPGPTGTGKTEISKALADALGTKLTRFDMGEYAESFKASNLFGSAKGYVGSDEGGALPNALRHSKKRCVLLFDEVEKAHQSLWRQMLAFFDEGRTADTLGNVVAPKDTICLLTSNLMADKIGENPDTAKDILKQSGYFPPEFLGRIDKIIPLLRLSAADTARLTVMLAKRVADRYGISLIIEQEALEELVNATFDEGEKYGGRGIQEKIMDLLGDDFIDLQGERISHARLVIKGDRLKVEPLVQTLTIQE